VLEGAHQFIGATHRVLAPSFSGTFKFCLSATSLLMERIEKTVFISYRRTNIPWALAIFQNLTQHGYDVFFDYNGIAGGDFDRAILGNITARAHFLVLLTPPHWNAVANRETGYGVRSRPH
jgi:hypothetical protein